jgi:hypothetical protein
MSAMDEFFNGLSNWVHVLKYPEVWISRRGLGALVAIALSCGWFLASCFDFTRRRQLYASLAFAAVTPLVWHGARIFYWHYGNGKKVGISGVLLRVPMSEWVETREQLARLCETYSQEQKVILKEIFPKVVDGRDRLSGEFRSIFEYHAGDHLRQQHAAVEFSPMRLS